MSYLKNKYVIYGDGFLKEEMSKVSGIRLDTLIAFMKDRASSTINRKQEKKRKNIERAAELQKQYVLLDEGDIINEPINIFGERKKDPINIVQEEDFAV